MSVLGRIKEAIFGRAKGDRPPAPSVDTTQAPGGPEPEPSLTDATATIDIENHLDSMPGADRLNWRTSIIDLLKLIGVPSDFESRQALAHELGRAEYTGSAEDNVWLHQQCMREIERNGGKVPANLLD